MNFNFDREDALWKAFEKFLLPCYFKIQGSGFDAQLVLSSAVLINSEVVIILGVYCYL